MKVFLTGGTGFVGEAVLHELLRCDHEVIALARKPQSAELLRQAGAYTIEGSLTTIHAIRSKVAECDVIVHAAADTRGDVQFADASALDTLLDVVARHNLQIVYTSGTLVYGDTGADAVDESHTLKPLKLVNWRPSHEQRVLSAGGTVLRPGWVCGALSGLPGLLARAGSKEGRVPVTGPGSNHVSLVHRSDLAVIFRHCVERHVGGIFNAASGKPATMREVSEMISEVLGLPLREMSVSEVLDKYGKFGETLLANQFVTSNKAEKTFGWVAKNVRPHEMLM